MKKKKYLLGFISLVAILIVSIFYLNTSEISLDNENFNGINLNQNINEFNEGDFSVDSNNQNFYNLYNGLRLKTDENGSITSIAITHDTDKKVMTSKGITVGDSLEDVKKKYGEDFYNRQEQGAEIIVYRDDNKYIEFWLWNNTVQEIRFGKKSIL